MPEAKRNKVVSLTQVKGKTHDHKDYIVEKARSFMKRFKSVYVLTYENMTTNNFKALKEELSDCKFLMGKNRVLGVAFGTDEENSFMPNSFRISPMLKGHCTLFFTNKKQEQIKHLFEGYEEDEFATGGTIATQTIILYKGFDALKEFPHSLESRFRQLGLPTKLVNSKIELLSDYVLCEEGKPITVEKCKILKHLNIKMSRMKFKIKAWYDGKSFRQEI